MQEAVVLVAPPAEEGVEGVHRLVGGDALRRDTIDVGGAFRGHSGGVY